MAPRLAHPPETPATASEETVELLEALRRLPMSQRLPVVLHHLLEMPVEEIAHELGISAGSVKSRLFRGRQALAARLAEAVEEVPDRG